MVGLVNLQGVLTIYISSLCESGTYQINAFVDVEGALGERRC